MRSADFSSPRILSNLISRRERQQEMISIVTFSLRIKSYLLSQCKIYHPLSSDLMQIISFLTFIPLAYLETLAFAQRKRLLKH
ncbi:uncharacterized protein SKDI_08G1860 [Saccharomyces kudriavzevii IFO 1802]|uniref:Uncharacterized protein n=1 Tax=Saccharomyces kudriavzevii (strain ATCC MYA-4449 / AS 2.2408 / CBS 8840 / NBRC 1802 / NCYC 2889) TaxID=226230 RepID=A0AA35JJ23_SACK1|nr:uncharacterized protein SKDI_08G1860 [Saccharomyces kudriavzevii IFO 1802]CAI4063957.1 hypothetical protein SKDI_08G1860 [Saccharomyces kudriavzevii IFO 1802]